jgi:hypothetical protein
MLYPMFAGVATARSVCRGFVIAAGGDPFLTAVGDPQGHPELAEGLVLSLSKGPSGGVTRRSANILMFQVGLRKSYNHLTHRAKGETE